MAKHTFGLQQVEIGPIAGDGGVSTSFAAVGETVSDTMGMTTEDPVITDFTIEGSDSPIESVVSTAAKVTLAWSCYNVDADTLIKFFGGTKVTGPPVQWQMPDAFPDVEVSLKITDKKGNVTVFPRVKLSPKLSLQFKKTALGQIDLVATVLQPTKSGEKRGTITYA